MSVKIKPVSEIKLRLGITPDGRVSKFAVNNCARHMDKYVPFDEGNLAKYYVIGNEIHYDQLYAQYQYYGQRNDGSRAINEANRNRNYHPLATSYWDKHMWTAEGLDVINEIEEYARRK